jgi:hypothetical protein
LVATDCGVERYRIGVDLPQDEYDDLVNVWYIFAFKLPESRKVEDHPLKGGEAEGSRKTEKGQVGFTLDDGTRIWCQGGTWEGDPTDVERHFRIDTNTALLFSVCNLEVDPEEFSHVFPNKEATRSSLIGEARNVVSDNSTKAEFTIKSSSGQCSFSKEDLDFISPNRLIIGLAPPAGLIPGHHISEKVGEKVLPRMAHAGYYILLKPLKAGTYTMTLFGNAPFFGKSGQRFENKVSFTITAE